MEVMLSCFAADPREQPVIYIHNHDFNGLGGHVGMQLLQTAQAHNYNFLVVDAGYRKNWTHNDNTLVCSALKLTADQKA